MTLAPAPLATTELVAVAWLSTVSGLAPGMVGTTLPRDTSGWSASGFVQALAVGGVSNTYVPLRSPAVRVTCWAVNLTSKKPPWGKANTLAEIVRAGCYDVPGTPRTLALGVAGLHARVLSAYLMGEPIREPNDDAAYAKYGFLVALNWIPL